MRHELPKPFLAPYTEGGQPNLSSDKGRSDATSRPSEGEKTQPQLILNGSGEGTFIFESNVQQSISEARHVLDHFIAEPQTINLSTIHERTDIETSVPPTFHLPEYKTYYPESVSTAIGELFAEYNQAFLPMIEANREWGTDYQYTQYDGINPANRWVQIDMVGLPQGFLDKASSMDPAVVREVLRGRTFEIENSLAMYQLLEKVHQQGNEPTRFDRLFRASIDELRERYGKPIALLAVTDQKYQAMAESEFGVMDGGKVSDEKVKRLSGFDRFFGPDDFLSYVKATGGTDHLLFVRSSDPTTKLKNPNAPIDHPLLGNDDIRRIIKAHSITFNVDNPATPLGSPAKINDSKAYLPTLNMGYRVSGIDDLWTVQEAGKNQPHTIHLNPEFRAFLLSQGIDPEKVDSDEVVLRAKPEQATYGGYGHHHAEIGNSKFRKDVRDGLKKRGPHIIQPEMKTPVIIDEQSGQAYTYIDRNFYTFDGTQYVFMNGFRSLMPLGSREAGRGRVHGNGATLWAEIL